MSTLITVTPAALEQLRVVLTTTDDPDLGLRAAARRGDDGAIEYGMGLDEPREQDEQIKLDDMVTVLVSVASRELIAGTSIDYVEVAPGEMRFVFYRCDAAPAADADQSAQGAADTASGCGCGSGGCGSKSV
jgi:iron-sulfur cluster assembly protein